MPRNGKRPLPHVNMLASWGRNVDPFARVCSIVAAHTMRGFPHVFALRIAFRSMADAHVFARDYLPASASPKASIISGKGGVPITWLAVDVDLISRIGGLESPRRAAVLRVRSILAGVRRAGYVFDYQADNKAVRGLYSSLDAFEESLRCVDRLPDAAPIRQYAD